ncbi:DUF6228 family protein [Krasilnikovia sp. MM14-A1259]|uniref:DUF6228 family protein n=1 Tax=Krasilnikovia sp. MM14-A1259 TaxID=3373539 RepID=UPI00382FF4CD
MEEPFVLGRADAARWVIHPLQDPYGDGYVLTAATELHDDGVRAATTAKIEGVIANPANTLPAFMNGLATDWRGWEGVRTWHSMESHLVVDARHDGRGHVSLRVSLRAPGPSWDDAAWSASAMLVLEAGEEMTRAAADLTHFLRWERDKDG